MVNEEDVRTKKSLQQLRKIINWKILFHTSNEKNFFIKNKSEKVYVNQNWQKKKKKDNHLTEKLNILSTRMQYKAKQTFSWVSTTSYDISCIQTMIDKNTYRTIDFLTESYKLANS